jgi:RHS repeat-associated protein
LIGQTYTGGSGALGDLTYSYDATGNRLATGGSFARSGLPISVPATSYDAANRQLTFGSAAQTFDANGNLLTQTNTNGTTTYTWDARNRLTALTGPTVSATFAYDALGRRTTKAINGQSTSVLYDGLDAVQESGPDGDVSYLRTLGIDEALSRTDANGTLTYLSDALGSTLALADSSGGLPTTYTYAPFGETSVSGLPASSPFQFTGRENDGTGLYYYRARYYDPGRGRFVSEDPLGLAGGDSNISADVDRAGTPQTNLYSYVTSNPINRIDPTGMWDIGKYLGWSISTTMPGGEGTVTYPGGTEQRSHSPLSLVGWSFDIQLGWLPPLDRTAYETGIGLSKHIGVGLVKTEATACGKTEYFALAFHIGIGFGSPIPITKYDPVWQRVTLPDNLNAGWTRGAGR